MNTLRLSAALMAGVVALSTAGPVEAAFSKKSLSGDYAYALDGAVTFLGGQPVGLPTWATGVIRADGKGKITLRASMISIGGCAIIRMNGDGQYTVEKNGSGSATSLVTITEILPIGEEDAPCPELPLALAPGAVIGFDFDFSIFSKGKALNLVGTSWTDEAGNPIAAFGSSGQATKQ